MSALLDGSCAWPAAMLAFAPYATGRNDMTPRQVLLQTLEHLDTLDPDHLPVVPLEAYFVGNDQEESIAPNQWGYG
ncbi:hypothetical protein DSI35_14910, partial [Mycobacterium tuberculosis]